MTGHSSHLLPLTPGLQLQRPVYWLQTNDAEPCLLHLQAERQILAHEKIKENLTVNRSVCPGVLPITKDVKTVLILEAYSWKSEI